MNAIIVFVSGHICVYWASVSHSSKLLQFVREAREIDEFRCLVHFVQFPRMVETSTSLHKYAVSGEWRIYSSTRSFSLYPQNQKREHIYRQQKITREWDNGNCEKKADQPSQVIKKISEAMVPQTPAQASQQKVKWRMYVNSFMDISPVRQ